jgi:hypothetical protein
MQVALLTDWLRHGKLEWYSILWEKKLLKYRALYLRVEIKNGRTLELIWEKLIKATLRNAVEICQSSTHK